MYAAFTLRDCLGCLLNFETNAASVHSEYTWPARLLDRRLKLQQFA